MRFWHTPAFRWGALAWRLLLFVGAQGSDDLAYSEAAWTASGPHYRVVNGVWVRNLWTWNGLRPPFGFEDPGIAPFRTETIAGRIRLRSLFRGRLDRVGTEEVRLYRLP